MKKIAFVCIHNSARSIMAEGWAKHFAGGRYAFFSAGTETYPGPKPLALEVMNDACVDMSHAKSKLLSAVPAPFDVLVTMGCGVECPYVPCKHREDWGLDDPSGKGKQAFEITRDQIKDKVLELIDRLDHNRL